MSEESMEQQYQQEIASQSIGAFRIASLLASILFPAFTLLDWYSHPDYYLELSRIRGVTTLIFILICVGFRRINKISHAYLASLLILSIADLSITLMALRMDGYKSPYYAGINLVILAGVLLFPWGAKKMAGLVSWLVAVYFIGVMIPVHFHVTDVSALVNNLSFMIGTAVIGVTSAHFTDDLRRRWFRQSLLTENAEDRIQQSVNILNDELHDESADVVELTRRIALQKMELEKAVESEQRSSVQARDALRARDEFISIASHELKTPLTVIKLQSEHLKRVMSRSELKPEMRALLQNQIHRNDIQISRLQRLIDDMLDLSRINSDRLTFQLENVDIGKMIREVVDRFSAQLNQLNMNVSFDLQEGLLTLCDRGRIEQVISNLITNAMKYAPEGPLFIRSLAANQEAVIEIQDHGKGIPEKFHQKIFERFERAEADAGITGLGLGLYISKKILNGHGGEIHVENVPAAGARFIVRLPLVTRTSGA